VCRGWGGAPRQACSRTRLTRWFYLLAELEEVGDDDDSDGDDDDEDGSRSKQSRSEKKSRKAMQKLGMKPVPGIIRCTVKKSKNVRAAQAWPLGLCCV
jgi:hypothetical protein